MSTTGAASAFTGFPSSGRATAIPAAFFTDVLPHITDGTDLAITLFAFDALMRKKGFPRYVTEADLAAELAVASYLHNAGAQDGAIARGLRRAAECGAFIELAISASGERRSLFFLNAPADRRAMESMQRETPAVASTPEPAAVRASIFKLYESVIGTVPSNLVDELAEAERLYPREWIESAFHEAAAQNARSWRYVSRILERWAIEGPDHAKAERDTSGAERYLSGKYGRILRQRSGG